MMLRFALRRIAWSLLVAWFVVTATFAMLLAIPSDPASLIAGPHADKETRAAVRERLCLDDGTVVAYGCYLDHLAHGDLGTSYRGQQPVADIVADHAWPTLQLALAAIVLSLAVGVPLGTYAARRRARWPDIAGAIAQAAPGFVVG